MPIRRDSAYNPPGSMGGRPAAAKGGGDSVAAESNMVFLETHEDVADTMRLILESTGEGIYGIDPQGACTFVNRAAARMFGADPADLVGQDVHALSHRHTRADGSTYPVEKCPIHRAFVDGVASATADEVFWRADGTSFPVEYSSYPILDKGLNKGAVVAFSDITQRRKMEDDLREANEKLRSWISDLERRNHEANLLNDMGDLLQSCFTAEEAQGAIAEYVEKLFPSESGALCMLNERNLVEAIAAWGTATGGEEIFGPEGFWALRRGQIYVGADPRHGLHCGHLGDKAVAPYLCVPMMARGAAIGVLHVMQTAEPNVGRSVDSFQPLARTVAEHGGLGMADFHLR